MRTIFKIFLLFLFININSQYERNYLLEYNGNTLNYNNSLLYTSIDSSIIGLVAHWSSQYEDHVDSLTFNSTGLTISSINDNEVTMNAVTGLKVGYSCRFTTGASGTMYTILEINGLILTLDQTCIASTTDELFLASYNSLYDGSGNGYHLAQSTPSSQPNVKWFGTDSQSIDLDGVDDWLDNSNFTEITSYPVSIIMKVKISVNSNAPVIDMAYSSSGNTQVTFMEFGDNIDFRIRDGVSTFENIKSTSNVIDDETHVCIINAIADDNWVLYYDGTSEGTQSGPETYPSNINRVSMGRFGDSSPGSYFEGEVFDVKIYNRILSSTEIASYSSLLLMSSAEADIYLKSIDDSFQETPPIQNAYYLLPGTEINSGWRNEYIQSTFSSFNEADKKVYFTINQLDSTIYVNNVNYTWDSIANQYNEENLIGPYFYTLKASKEIEYKPLVTFIDDDGKPEVYTRFRPLLATYGDVGTAAIIIEPYESDEFRVGGLDSTSVRSLVNDYGFYMTNHTLNHGYPNDPPYIMWDEWVLSNQKLGRLGYDTSYAVYPGGGNNDTLREFMHDHFDGAFDVRGDFSFRNYPPITSYQMARISIGDTTHSLATLKSWVDDAVADNYWLVLFLHCYQDRWENTGSEVGYPTEWLEPSGAIPNGWRPQEGNRLYMAWELIQYIHELDIDIVNPEDGFDLYGNITEVGDYTEDMHNPFYVVGADSSVIFIPTP